MSPAEREWLRSRGHTVDELGACEKCWGDAYLRSMSDGQSQSWHYGRLLEETAAEAKAATHGGPVR